LVAKGRLFALYSIARQIEPNGAYQTDMSGLVLPYLRTRVFLASKRAHPT